VFYNLIAGSQNTLRWLQVPFSLDENLPEDRPDSMVYLLLKLRFPSLVSVRVQGSYPDAMLQRSGVLVGFCLAHVDAEFYFPLDYVDHISHDPVQFSNVDGKLMLHSASFSPSVFAGILGRQTKLSTSCLKSLSIGSQLWLAHHAFRGNGASRAIKDSARLARVIERSEPGQLFPSLQSLTVHCPYSVTTSKKPYIEDNDWAGENSGDTGAEIQLIGLVCGQTLTTLNVSVLGHLPCKFEVLELYFINYPRLEQISIAGISLRDSKSNDDYLALAVSIAEKDCPKLREISFGPFETSLVHTEPRPALLVECSRVDGKVRASLRESWEGMDAVVWQ
jgi:hypothetical protein